MSLNSNAVCQTVTGLLPASALGHIQCHEHIWLRRGPSAVLNPALCIEDFTRSLTELHNYRSAGGGAIVDAQPGFFGRDAEVLRRLSAFSGVSILAVTGFHKLQFMELQAPLLSLSIEHITALYKSELLNGMLLPDGNHSSVRAGLIKVAYERSGWLDADYAALFTAAAAAAADTGAPVMVHTEPGNDILGLIAWFALHGVQANKLLICHLDRTHHDSDYHRQVLSTGCTLCYDSIHREKYVSQMQEISLIQSLCAEGFHKQLVLSLDTTNQRLRSYGAADMGLDYLLTTFLPALRQAGVCESCLEAMCKTNATQFLQFDSREVSV